MKTLKQVVKEINRLGVTSYYVGGFVRDEMLGVLNKDIDIEVFGLSQDVLIKLLSNFGTCKLVGKQFGVIKLTIDGLEFDFSIPRSEIKIGEGHKGFSIALDPNLPTKKASERRDFTFNSMMVNVITGELVDNFRGKLDLENKLLRHTSSKFSEDPLRVLRAFQFAGRFDLTLVPETTKLCRNLKDKFNEISKERIWIEIWKWATKSEKPSKGLDVLFQTNWLHNFPHLFNLVGVPQDKEYHPEGDVWEHTKLVCDEINKIAIRENLDETKRGNLVLAALCHDIAKPQCTIIESNGRITSRGHAEEGKLVAEEFLKSINAPNSIILEVCELVEKHMLHISYTKVSKRVVRRLLSNLKYTSLGMLLFLIEADHSGRPPLAKGLPANALRIKEKAKEIGNEFKPILSGRHLIELGFTPSPNFGLLLAQAKEAQIEGIFSNVEDGKKWMQAYADNLITMK